MKKVITLSVIFLAGINIVTAQVGIGTTTPTSRLEVKGTGTTAATSALNVTNNGSTSLLFVRDDGKLGVGTTSPVQLLHLSGNSSSNAVDGIPAVRVENSNSTGYAELQLKNNLGYAFQVGMGGSTTINPAYQNAFYIYNNNSGTADIFIGPADNVGINNTAPTSRLQVAGSVALPVTTTTTSLTLTNNHYTIIITGGTPVITLPAASTCTGRVYVISNRTAAARTTGAYLNLSGVSVTTIAAASTITIQSDGANWQRIQ